MGLEDCGGEEEGGAGPVGFGCRAVELACDYLRWQEVRLSLCWRGKWWREKLTGKATAIEQLSRATIRNRTLRVAKDP